MDDLFRFLNTLALLFLASVYFHIRVLFFFIILALDLSSFLCFTNLQLRIQLHYIIDGIVLLISFCLSLLLISLYFHSRLLFKFSCSFVSFNILSGPHGMLVFRCLCVRIIYFSEGVASSEPTLCYFVTPEVQDLGFIYLGEHGIGIIWI